MVRSTSIQELLKRMNDMEREHIRLQNRIFTLEVELIRLTVWGRHYFQVEYKISFNKPNCPREDRPVHHHY